MPFIAEFYFIFPKQKGKKKKKKDNLCRKKEEMNKTKRENE